MIHRWTGFIAGLFLLIHIPAAAISLLGEETYITWLETVYSLPNPLVVTFSIVVCLAMGIHGFTSLWQTTGPIRESTNRRLEIARRVGGIVLLAFIIVHVPALRIYSEIPNSPESAPIILRARLSSGPLVILYILALSGLGLTVAMGLQSLLKSRFEGASPWPTRLAVGVGSLLFVLGFLTVIHYS